MKRKLAFLHLVVVVAVLVWVLWPGGTDDPGTAPPGGTVARDRAGGRRVGPGGEGPGQRPRPFPEIIEDDDPLGTLRLEGQVLDLNDLPVGGAEVTISTNPARVAVAEKDGSFHFDELVGKRYRLSAHKGGLVGGPVTHRLTETSQPVIIRLAAGSTVEVSVVSQEGGGRKTRPVAGAAVELESAGSQALETGVEGIARFEGVAPGFCSLTVQAPGFTPSRQFLAVPRGARRPIQIRVALQRGVRVSGRVVTETGEPVAGARVVASETGAMFQWMDEDFAHAVTDPEGRFAIPVVAVGNHRFTATHRDHPPASTQPLGIDRARDDVEIVMLTGARVEGRVVTADNAEAPWANVRLREVERRMRFGRRRGATADEHGAFRFGGLPRQKVELMAIGDTSSSEVVTVDLTREPVARGVVLRLTLDGRIAGQVVNREGEPVPEVYVTARPDFLSGEAPQDMGMRRGSSAMTDGGGAFVFEGLSEGTYQLRASRTQTRQRGPGFMMRRGVRARTGDENVVVRLEEAGGIRGRVVLASGEVPERFGVSLEFSPAIPFADERGEFEVSPVEAGDHFVTIHGEDFADVQIDDVQVESGKTTDLGEIVIQPGRAVSGRVVDPGGRPVEGAKVMIGEFLVADGTSLGAGFPGRGGASDNRSVLTGGDGSFQFESVSTEGQVVGAEHPERGRSDVVRLQPGKDGSFLELVLHGFGSVTGLVTSGAGTPVADARVSARPAGGGSVTMVQAGADGRYLIEKLPEGEHRIEASRGGGPRMGRTSLRKNVAVRAQEVTQADFHFDVGEATLVVDIRGAGGAVIDFAWITLLQGQVSFSSVREMFMLGASYEGTVRSSMWLPARPARFSQLVPDGYSVCVIPLQGDMRDFRRMRALREQADRLQVQCFPRAVVATTEEQVFAPEVVPMEPLPAEAGDPADGTLPPPGSRSVQQTGQPEKVQIR